MQGVPYESEQPDGVSRRMIPLTTCPAPTSLDAAETFIHLT